MQVSISPSLPSLLLWPSLFSPSLSFSLSLSVLSFLVIENHPSANVCSNEASERPFSAVHRSLFSTSPSALALTHLEEDDVRMQKLQVEAGEAA